MRLNAVFPVEGNEGLEQKVDALLKERGYAVYDRMQDIGACRNWLRRERVRHRSPL